MKKEILLTLNEQVQPKHTALLIVDPQKDFCASEGKIARLLGLDVSRIQAAVRRLNPFIRKAREAGLLVVWTRSLDSPGMMMPNQKARSAERQIDIAVEGSDGASWYSEMTKPLPDEYITTKRNYDGFDNTELDLLLHTNGIKTLVFTGFMANVCVETTARHGYIKGYYIILVSDCTDCPMQQDHESTIHNIERYFGKVVTSSELIKIWRRVKSGK